jgi:polysaccharide biosynthesis protein PslG
MPRTLLLLLALLGLNAGEVGLPKAGTLDGVGVNIHFTHAKPGELEMLAAGGFRVVRMDFVWESIEKEPGRYDFAAYDHLMADLDRLGLRAYFILDYGHRLYDGGLSPHTDEGRAGFCAFVKAAMQHFAGRGIVWELWNEPNISFWKPKPNADDYAKLALAVGETIRAVTPKEIFVGPTTSEIDLTFMETCFKAGCLSYWDAVSVHPYRHRPPETVADDYRTMRQLIRRYAPKGPPYNTTYKDQPVVGPPKSIPILSGEWGYSSSVDGWGTDYDEERQGQYLPRQWLTNIANEVPISIWYDWHDDGTDPKEAEHNFGTVRHAYRDGQAEVYEPKPAYLAAKTLTTVLKGYTFSKALALKDDEHVLLFARGDQLRLAAWTSASEPRTVIIPAHPGRFRVSGHLGQERLEEDADEQGLTLELNGDVQYLAPIDANPSLRLAVAWERLPLDLVVALPPTTAPLVVKNLAFNERVTPPVDAETMTLTLFLHLTNPLERPLHIGAFPEKLLYNHSTVHPAVFLCGERAPTPEPVATSLDIDGRVVWTQPGVLVTANPLSLSLLTPFVRDGATVVPVLLDNSEGTNFKGGVVLLDESGTTLGGRQSIALLDGQQQIVLLPLKESWQDGVALGVRVDAVNSTRVLRSVTPTTLRPLFRPGIDWRVEPDGDNKVASAQSVKPGTGDIDPALIGQATLDLDYRLDKGWKFLRVAPNKPIDLGAAKEIRMWVFGDGSGNVARLRVIDASGQTFQPDAGRLNFTGWKWLTFAITPHTAHWGGANDGVARPPLKLDTLFLLDQADQSRPSQGTVRIAGAMAVE